MSQRTLKSYVDAAERQFPGLNSPGSTSKPPHSLTVEVAGGERFGFPYGHVVWSRLQGARRIDIVFGSHSVHVDGEHLEPVFASLLDCTCRVLSATPAEVPPSRSAEENPADRPAVPSIQCVIVMQRPNPFVDGKPDTVEPEVQGESPSSASPYPEDEEASPAWGAGSPTP